MSPISPFGWKDKPAGGTPLDAADLESWNSFLGAYADAVSPGVVNVMGAAYGAKGNGIADDTTAIQNAINAASGRVIVLPGGYNFLVSTLTPTNNTTISGYGATITQKVQGGPRPAVFQDLGSPPTVKSEFTCLGVKFVGTGLAETEDRQAAMWLQEWNDITVRDCVAENFVCGGFQFANCKRVIVDNSQAIKCCKSAGRNAINFMDAPNGSVNYMQDVQITNNYVRECPTCPVGIVQGSINNKSLPVLKAIVTGNDLEVAGTHTTALQVGILVEHEGGSGELRGIVISNNAIKAKDPETHGIGVLNSAQVNSITVLQDITITGNTITGEGYGIFAEASRLRIADNLVDTSNSCIAIYCEGSEHKHQQYVEVAENTLRTGVNPKGEGTLGFFGLLGVQYADHVRVQGNRLVSAAGATTSEIPGMEISNCGWADVYDNNVEYVPGTGLLLSGCNDFSIAGNRIYNINDQNGGNSRGINIGEGSGLNVVRDNVIVDDREPKRMEVGLEVAAGAKVHAIDNFIFGAKAITVLGTFEELVGTRTTAKPKGESTITEITEPGAFKKGSAGFESEAEAKAIREDLAKVVAAGKTLGLWK